MSIILHKNKNRNETRSVISLTSWRALNLAGEHFAKNTTKLIRSCKAHNTNNQSQQKEKTLKFS